jgi:hypothetical protein
MRTNAEQEDRVKRRFASLAVIAMVAGGALHATQGQGPDPKAAPEIVQIDGGKNPELIPEWNAWGFAFRLFATGSRQLPSSVHFAVSTEEAAMLMKEADQLQKVDQDCRNRVVKLHDLLGKEPDAVLDRRLRDITLECRWATLHARDRVLEALKPEGVAALTAFVASTKVGTSVAIPKKDLARFLEPQ